MSSLQGKSGVGAEDDPGFKPALLARSLSLRLREADAAQFLCRKLVQPGRRSACPVTNMTADNTAPAIIQVLSRESSALRADEPDYPSDSVLLYFRPEHRVTPKVSLR
jgi:hypothetical protein